MNVRSCILPGPLHLSAWAFVLCAGLALSRSARGEGGPSPLELGAARSYRNLTLVPVYSRARQPSATYMTLDEGLSKRVVDVEESRSGALMNLLFVNNRSNRPLFMLAGEVLLGGWQDRSVASDTVIPANRRDVPVPVFCVEHGRWAGRSSFARLAPMVATAEVRGAGQDADFPPVVSGAEISEGSVERAQHCIWRSVEDQIGALGSASATGAYRVALDLRSAPAVQRCADYLRQLPQSIGSGKRVIGMVVAVNGEFLCADLFPDSRLFPKLWPKLRRSYIADAAMRVSNGRAISRLFTARQARRMLSDAMASAWKGNGSLAAAAVQRYVSRSSTGYRLVDRRSRMSPAHVHSLIVCALNRKDHDVVGP